MWALRTLKDPYIDFWNEKKLNNKYIIPLNKILESYFKIDTANQNLYKVHSCFNEYRFYKYEHIIDCTSIMEMILVSIFNFIKI